MVAPVVNAGVDQPSVEPYTIVTLTGTATSSTGTIASTSWTQTNGPTVALAGSGLTRTFQAPATLAGATLTFRLSATDNSNATSTDDVVVTVLSVTERAIVGGVEVPEGLQAAVLDLLRNYARSPRFNGFKNTGQGRFANDRFGNNVTYTDVQGATDGPTLVNGTKLTRYTRFKVTASRTRLGYHLADVIENTTPTPVKEIAVKPGEKWLLAALLRSSAAATMGMFARGSDGVSAWVDPAAVSVGSASLPAGVPTWVWGIYTVPDGVYSLGYAPWAPAALANDVTVDGFLNMAEKVDSLAAPLPQYVDPDISPAWAWAGTPGDSESYGPPYTGSAPVDAWLANVPAALPWAPPFDPANPPAGTMIVTIDDTTAKRHINGGGGRVLLIWPNSAVTDIASVNTYESLVTVENFTDLVSIGGWCSIQQIASTTLAAAVDASVTTIPVASTAPFPSVGMVRVEGELIRYTSRGTDGQGRPALLGCTRQAGYFNNGTGSSNGAHPAGAKVYISERQRSALSLKNWTGTAHVEGLRIDGFVCDGLRVSSGSTQSGILQYQRFRIEGVTNYDQVGETDGHPDGIQAYGGGCREIRLAQGSIVLGPNGNGLINKGSDSAP